MRFLLELFLDQQQHVHFDSNAGMYLADTELGQPDAKYWDSHKEKLVYNWGTGDSVCQHNYGVPEKGHSVWLHQ